MSADYATGLLLGAASGMSFALTFWWLLNRIVKRFEKSAEEPSAARIPEVGDEYLILDHMWRVRSREATSLGAEQRVEYVVFIEFVDSGIYALPYEGTKMKRVSPTWLDEFDFIGNMPKDRETVQQAVQELADQHGASIEEVREALKDVANEGEYVISIPPGPSDEEVVENFHSAMRTLTGHQETDRSTAAAIDETYATRQDEDE